MKIGVLTFCSTEDNYGQVLQCYALQFYLNSMGHETYLIKYDASVPDNGIFAFINLFCLITIIIFEDYIESTKQLKKS